MIWEFAVGALFSMWVNIPVGRIYAGKNLKPTQHVNRLTEIKDLIPRKPANRR